MESLNDSYVVLIHSIGLSHPSLCSTYTVEWENTEKDHRYEIDLYYCNSYCTEVSAELASQVSLF